MTGVVRAEIYTRHRSDLTFIACDCDKHNGADAQEGEHYHQLSTCITRSFEREADYVDKGDGSPAVEHHYQDHRRSVLVMCKCFLLIPQKHQLKNWERGNFGKVSEC